MLATTYREALSQLPMAPLSDAPPHRRKVSRKQVRDSYSARTSNWKPQSTYVLGQFEYVLAESTEACRIAACTSVEIWNSVDCRATDFVCPRKTSHRGSKATQRLSKKLESLLDDERGFQSDFSSASVLVSHSESSVLLAAPCSYQTLNLASLKIPTWDELVKWRNVADDDCWLSDMPTRPASQASTASSPHSAGSSSASEIVHPEGIFSTSAPKTPRAECNAKFRLGPNSATSTSAPCNTRTTSTARTSVACTDEDKLAPALL